MKRTTQVGILLAALGATPAHAEPGLLDRMMPASAMEALRSWKDALTPAAEDKPVFRPANAVEPKGVLNNRPGNTPPPQRQEPPQRQAPPPQRQEPPQRQAPPPQRQDPPRRDPAPTFPTPPHRDPAPAPQPPHRDPNPAPAPRPPHRDPNPAPAPQPPHRDPNPAPAPRPPHRDPNPAPAPQPPHRDPNPAPAPQPPHRDPNPAPAPRPPHRDPNPAPAPQPPHRDPNPPHNPQRPPQEPPHQRPPVVIPPHQPDRPGRPGDHRMPVPPKPVDPDHRMDPGHHGDDHANRPPDRGHDGRPLPQHPGRDHDGRLIPPGRGDLGRIDNDENRRRMHDRQDRWDRNDHDYHWDNWRGMPVCHHYDEFGFHWWGFYVGSSYYWSRFDGDRFWWFDPYWHRWDSLHDGQWWWQDVDGTLYVYSGGFYYRYGYGSGGVVMTPDPTPPVVVPPGRATPPAATPSAYSLDGTRSVQIVGNDRDAYLYDLTLTDANDPRAQGTWLATGVTNAGFTYNTTNDSDGTTTQTLQQIVLSYDDPSAHSTVDPNGERKVDVSGDARNAYLYNLADDTVSPVFLAAGVNGVTMIVVASQDASGESIQSLAQIVVTTTDGDGNPASLTFDRDGAAALTGPSSFSPTALRRGAAGRTRTLATPTAVQRLQQKMSGSGAFGALKAGLPGW